MVCISVKQTGICAVSVCFLFCDTIHWKRRGVAVVVISGVDSPEMKSAVIMPGSSIACNGISMLKKQSGKEM